MTKLLTAKAILTAKPRHAIVDVPEWGGSVRLEAFTIARRLALLDVSLANDAAISEWDKADEAARCEKPERLDTTLLIVMFAIVDDQGQQVFTMADYQAFKSLGYSTIEKLYAAFSDINQSDVAHDTKKKPSA